MNDKSTAEAEKKSRLRWVTLGEAIALAALIVSAATMLLIDGAHGPMGLLCLPVLYRRRA